MVDGRPVPAVACRACRSSVGKVRMGSDGGDSAFTLLECGVCGLVYSDSPVSDFDEPLYEYYEQRLEWPRERVYEPVNASRYHELLASFEARTASRRLLDVGSGAGHLVHVASERGWEASGIELSASAVSLSNRLGAPSRLIDFMDAELDDQRFDVITMIEVLEHVADPKSFLVRAHALLVEGGLVYLTTPNFAAITRRVLGADWRVISPEHLSYFTPRTLARLVRDHTQLEVERMSTRNVSLSALRQAFKRGERQRSVRGVGPWCGSPSADPDYGLRSSIERSRILRAGKASLNGLLDLTRSGETLVALLRKPSRT